MKSSLIKDVSAMTNIPQKMLRSIGEIEECLIADAVCQSKRDNEDSGEIELSFGVLSYSIEADSVKFRLRPSKRVADLIKQMLENNIPIPEIMAEQSLARRISDVYKEFF